MIQIDLETLVKGGIPLETAKLILNTKHYNTKHQILDTNTLDSHDETSDPLVASSLSGSLAGTQVESSVSVVGNPSLVNSQVEYLAVSLKTPKVEGRLEANVDFKLEGSRQFNKLVFNLVGWDRRREFFANIEDIKDWIGYQQAYNTQTKTGFIGKGRLRNSQTKKAGRRNPIKPECSMLIELEEMICHLWIEEAYWLIPLDSWNDSRKWFCAKGEVITNTNKTKAQKGGWV